tara:strand:+ start:358083 stop:360152 length:2070 start_codon:yes stop_codon:yes gene_type:complete
MSSDQHEETSDQTAPDVNRSSDFAFTNAPITDASHADAPSAVQRTAEGPTAEGPIAGHIRGHGGSLRSKLVLSLAAMFFLFLTIDEVVRQKVVRPAFSSLERNAAIRDSNRVLAAMNAEVQHLSELAFERAKRLSQPMVGEPDSSPDLRDREPLTDAQDKTWALSINADGTHQWIHQVKPNSTEADDEAASAWAEEGHASSIVQSLTRLCSDAGESRRGTTRAGRDKIMMFAAVRIHPTDDAGHGDYLVLAREIDATMTAALRRQTQVDFYIDTSPQHESAQKMDVWEVADSTFVEVQLADSFDGDLATLKVDVPRDLSTRSNRTSAMARQSFILGASAALLLLLLLLQRIVISPLIAIREYSDRVAVQGLQAEPLIIPRNDEIGELAVAFERMMQRLGSAQIRLASASRAAGMSQVADTVIHNVGNVLTNVNSLIESATDRVKHLRVDPLGKLANRLQEDQADTDLRKAMPEYLHGLADSLEQDQRDLSELLTTLNDNVRHIHDVIRDQRRHATTTINQERIALGEVVCEAIRCCQARLDRDSVRVEVSGTIDANVLSDRSMLLQIMINIIGNARQAMRHVDRDKRSLLIRSVRLDRTIQLEFRDSGCGMTEATLGNIFEAHYTTRDHGSGLGLHFCAITLKRLGGSIHARSEGLGKGATFVLELPVIAEQSRSDQNEIANGATVSAS